MVRIRLSIALLPALALLACSGHNAPSPPDVLTIAAAADLKFALDEAISQFKKANPATEVKITYGSSGNFYTQVQSGAPFDLFLSADMEYPRKLEDSGLAIKGTEFEYAVGRLGVWTRNQSPIDVQKLEIDSLLQPSVKWIGFYG